MEKNGKNTWLVKYFILYPILKTVFFYSGGLKT